MVNEVLQSVQIIPEANYSVYNNNPFDQKVEQKADKYNTTTTHNQEPDRMSLPTLSIINPTATTNVNKNDDFFNINANSESNNNFFADEFKFDVNKQSGNKNVEIYGNFDKDEFDFWITSELN